MRLAISGALLADGVVNAPVESFPLTALRAAEGLSAVLLLVGLETPISAGGATVIALWRAYSHPADVLLQLLVAALGAALVLLGPGAFSADARIFGWRRIDVSRRARRDGAAS